MSYNLFLDDYRIPHDGFNILHKVEYLKQEWEIVRSYEQFIAFIERNGLPILVSFDHDLADAHYHESMYKDGKVYMKYLETTSEKTGMDCAKWLVEYCMNNKVKLPRYFVHSANPVGKQNIQSLLDNYVKFENTDGGEEI